MKIRPLTNKFLFFTLTVKPENLAALSNLNNIQSSIGNALLNLASLGSLAALQQSLPGILSSVGSSSSGITGLASGGGTVSGSSPSHTSPQTGGGSSTSPSATSMNAPLNLTHATGMNIATTKNHHQSGNSNIGSSSHGRGQHSSSPSVGQFSHQAASAFSHCNSLGGGGSPSSLLGAGGMIPPNLVAYFNQASGVGASGSGSSFLSNSTQLTNSLSHAAASVQSPGSLPQLVLASGQIMQGIQGAQLLIPTSQGMNSFNSHLYSYVTQ